MPLYFEEKMKTDAELIAELRTRIDYYEGRQREYAKSKLVAAKYSFAVAILERLLEWFEADDENK